MRQKKFQLQISSCFLRLNEFYLGARIDFQSERGKQNLISTLTRILQLESQLKLNFDEYACKFVTGLEVLRNLPDFQYFYQLFIGSRDSCFC